MLTQFTDATGRATLADYLPVPKVYAAGRLDADSEGLVVLTDDGALQAQIADPRHKLEKRYWAQVEGIPTDAALRQLEAGVDLGDFQSQSCQVHRISVPEGLWERGVPIRYRAAIPATWLEIVLREGKNRQVRRMTAHVGFPTLRLIRWAVGNWTLAGLLPGQWRELEIPRQPDQKPRVKDRNAPNLGRFRKTLSTQK